MADSKNSIVVLITSAPYDGIAHRETMDAVLAMAAFDQPVQPIFLHDGVFQLLNEQNPERISQKNISKMITALPLYGIESVYALDDSLSERQVSPQHLLSLTTVIDRQCMNTLIQGASHVFSF